MKYKNFLGYTKPLLLGFLILCCCNFVSAQQPNTNAKSKNFAKYDQSIPTTNSALSKTTEITDKDALSKIADTPDYPISLLEAVLITLENNLDIKVSNYSSEISKYELESQKGIYDTVLRASHTESEEDVQTSTDPKKIRALQRAGVPTSGYYYQRSRVSSSEIALSQLIPTGAYLELFYDHRRIDFQDYRGNTAFDPYYSDKVGLSLKQPLLKGFGPTVTNAGIKIARINKKINTEALKKKIMDQVYEVIKTYWDLSYAIDNFAVQELSLKQAQDLLRINTIKYETGVLPSTDVLQAKAKVATREEQVLIAKSAIKAYQDRLKQLMNIKEGSDKWNVSFTVKEKPIRDSFELNESSSFDEALKNHPDIVSLKKAIDIAKINVLVAKNMKNPELNFFAGYDYTGAGDSIENSYGKLATKYYRDWQVGLEFKYPLLNRQARYNFKKSETELEKSQTQLKNIENLIMLGIRNAIRDVETNLKRIDITKAGVEFEEAKLDAEQKRYDVGMSTSFNILTFQEDLAIAKSHHLSSIIDYNKAIASYEYSKGSILEALRIKVDEPKEEETFMDKLFD